MWHGSCSAPDRKALQRVVKAAQRSVRVSLPTTTDIYTSRCRKTCIMKDPTHPAHSLFVPLPSGRRLWSNIYNTSLSQAIVPQCFIATTIVPLPKKKSASSPSDYCHIALTPIIMKCFERLVKDHITSRLPATFDQLQFAYCPNRSTDDAISSALHLSLTHLANKNSYVWMLFNDFSSAFNTVIPQHLVEKLPLGLLGIDTP
ncbi:hypothetical protein NFI96_015999, partial [Prochilodus magdalenae]